MHNLRDFGEDVLGRSVRDRVRRIEPEAVNVKFTAPIAGVFNKEFSHRFQLEIQAIAPGRLVPWIEIVAAISAEIIAVRTEVVVDHVENDRETALMCRIDQRTQVVRSAIDASRRVKQHAVVTPVACPRKIGDRHDLDCCNAEVDQVIELADRRVEGSLRREGANVQLVNDQFGNSWRRPGAIAPCVIAWVNHLLRRRGRRQD